jgi:DHA1 family tetracycline resistance protein-like MFS transporter
MAVLAPMAATLLGLVSPPGDWLMGLPFFFCSGLQAAGAVIAIRYFRRRALLAAVPA